MIIIPVSIPKRHFGLLHFRPGNTVQSTLDREYNPEPIPVFVENKSD
jgi:hypothetical protein